MKIDELYKNTLSDDTMPVSSGAWDKLNSKMNASVSPSDAASLPAKGISAATKYILTAIGGIAVSVVSVVIYNNINNTAEDTTKTALEENIITDNSAQETEEYTKDTLQTIIMSAKEYKMPSDEFEITDDEIIAQQLPGTVLPPQTFVSVAPDVKAEDLIKVEPAENKNTVEQNNTQDSSFKADILIPNVITPNGDGVNDCFVIKNIENYPDNTLTVFNRNGKAVYIKRHYNNEFCPQNINPGAYFYTLKIRIGTKVKEFNGSLTVIR